MPMGDMTGPQGQGPGTGRQMGQMAGNPMGMGQGPGQGQAPAPASAPSQEVINAFRTLAIFVASRMEQGDPNATQMQQALGQLVNAMKTQGPQTPAPAPAQAPAQGSAPVQGPAPMSRPVPMGGAQTARAVPAQRGRVSVT